MAFEISPQWRTWRSDLRENDETRLDEGEEPDVCPDPREHVAAVEPLDGVEETRGSVEDLVAVNPAVDLRHGVQSGYYFIDKSGFFRFWVLAF